MRRSRSAKLALLAAAILVPALSGMTAAQANPTTPTPVNAGHQTGLSTLGTGGWRVQSSATATQAGSEVSSPGFDTSAWLPVRPDDAGAPGTEITALLQNGACPDVFTSDNMRTCFGYMSKRGPVTVPRFAVPWWFRTDFSPSVRSGQHAELILNGVIGAADVWVNGSKVAGHDTVTGAYARRSFDVSSLVRAGRNSLAVEMYPNDPNSMFSLDDADWNQIPPDNNTGLQYPVQLRISDALTVSNAHVTEQNTTNVSHSALTVKTDVTNTSGSAQRGDVSATVTPPSGAPIRVTQSVTVAANTTKTVSFTPQAFPALSIDHPKVWWPYQLGAQPLYTLDTSVRSGPDVSSTPSETFGIRTITTSLVGGSPQQPDGARSFQVNGRAFVFRGGGYVPDLFLRYSKADVAHQIALIRNMGLDGIRLEGHDMPDDFYQQLDRAGIMVDSGFLCCDRWELPSDGAGVTAADYQVIHDSALTLGQRLRNHPSVIDYSWSDNNPIPRQESASLSGFHEADFQQPIIASAEYKSTPTLGPSGEKEGPYDWVPPSYWYDTTHFDPSDDSRTNVGGSWAFDSEASAGDTVPTLDSIRRFLSTGEQAKLWQQPDYNQYHANYEPGHGGYKFGTLYTFDTALSTRYGQWSDLASYVEQAQVANYENARSQFESFIDHSTDKTNPSTGIVYWQLNKGWPTLLWSLYNDDGDQAGSFFGAKKANEPLHVLYGYDNGTVSVDNLGGAAQSGLSVQSTVYDTAGTVLDRQTAGGIALNSQGVRNAVLTPKVPATTTAPAPAKVSFVELVLRQHGKVVDRNVYWISSQHDVVDWDASQGNPQATLSQYADLSALRSLPAAKLKVTAGTPRSGVSTVTITNTSSTPAVGFFLRADVRRGTASGHELPGDNQVAAATWDDNDITLWPGESQTLTATYSAADLRGATPVISVSGWNTPKVDVPARG